MKIIRIQEIEIKNFKSVRYGKIEFAKKDNISNILEDSKMIGIYGQNGSGKTSIIEVAEILKFLLHGEKLDKNILGYITKDSDSCVCIIKFYVEDKERFLISLKFEIFKEAFTNSEGKKEEKLNLSEELRIKEYTNGKWEREKLILSTANQPKSLQKIIENSKEILLDYNVSKLLTQREARSFIFSTELLEILKKLKNNEKIIYFIELLREYGMRNLYIIKNSQSSLVNGNLVIPLSFRCKTNSIISQGIIFLNFESTFLTNKEYNLMTSVIKQLNIVLESLIPGLKIQMKLLKEEINKDSEDGKIVKLFSKRDEMRIPLEYESDGIKKIITILSTLVVVYNEPSFSLFIDELDAGIFEYLLGELLRVIEKYGKGQLIFTSHNLRPLEVLEPQHLRFSTVVPENKYIKKNNVKKTNNLRNVYMREIFIEDGKIPLYIGNSFNKIRKAFEKAGCENE